MMPGLAPSPNAASWGWTSYRRAGWLNQQGQRLYVVHFQSTEGQNGYTRITLHVWARRPVLALRALCKEKKSEEELLRYDWASLD
ncbi:hypothetical protein [Nitrospira sp. BLG_2]|uniref:hypothetical protein n=1 Tax=Nitrospira sp. BLG_2 TaxID=3397507 RepID=UPI003B9AF037